MMIWKLIEGAVKLGEIIAGAVRRAKERRIAAEPAKQAEANRKALEARKRERGSQWAK